MAGPELITVKQDQADLQEVLSVASEAGHILLENGAEISRVEDIMYRIASYYGVDSGHFFVLSNGIFTSGSLPAEKIRRSGRQTSSYANIQFIPIRSVQLGKVVEVNRLSYDIAAGKCTLAQAKERLEAIRKAPGKPRWETLLGYAFASCGFTAIFGGGFLDCAAAFFVGLLTYAFVALVSSRYLSRIVGGIANALVATLCCILFCHLGFGKSLSDIIIGSLMPLVPGVPFVNGVRDLAASDYLAGLTRLTDAVLGFINISLGVSLAFLLDGWIFGGLASVPAVSLNPETAGYLWQALAACIGTVAFAVLFSVPRQQYAIAGIIGTAGWIVYLLCVRVLGCTPPVATLFSSLYIGLHSRFAAVRHKVPSTVLFLCGIFPLVPGAGIFWGTYYTLSSQFSLAFSNGFMALKVALAIVLGLIFAMELPQRIFSRKRR